jgi:uncharacterized DUF497 family protein
VASIGQSLSSRPRNSCRAFKDHSLSEKRFITVGISRNGRVLIVAHSDRGENVRIISARKTTLHERKYYEEEN